MKLSRDRVSAMTPEQIEENWDDIQLWLVAGAPENVDTKSLDPLRVDGHVFTRAEVTEMPQAELEANHNAILKQANTQGLR